MGTVAAIGIGNDRCAGKLSGLAVPRDVEEEYCIGPAESFGKLWRKLLQGNDLNLGEGQSSG